MTVAVVLTISEKEYDRGDDGGEGESAFEEGDGREGKEETVESADIV